MVKPHEPPSPNLGSTPPKHEAESPDSGSLAVAENPAPASENPVPASENPVPASENPVPASENPVPASENPAPAAGWESILQSAVLGHWDEAAFAERARMYGLPDLPLGVPVLVRCQAWHPDIPLILRNFLPRTEVFLLNDSEIFLYTSPEGSSDANRKSLLSWAAGLISQIHSVLADELGILSYVYVDTPGTRGLWESYLALQRLARVHRRFFPGEAGLAQWQAGFAQLFAQSPSEPLEHYSGSVLGKLSPELRQTLQTYFHTGLSLTESARLLYIHRNTLIYRLDRITELTGYNPRDFRQAVSLFLAVWLAG
ncbi:purine catabolism regulatory protein [Peptococcaceae bacterium CEB3]|nr:purine catabolism regulatory protein [Peptococcaceae bacterium CEB3]